MTVLIGSNPEQVPLNGTLGNMAFQSKERVNITGGTLSNVTINSPTVPGLIGTVLTNGTLSDTVEAVGASTYSIASQYDIGTGANQIPLNQFLGTMAYQDAASVNVGRLTVTGQSTKTITVPVASNGSTAVPSETSLIGAWFYTGAYEAGIYSINTYNSDFGNGLLFKTTNTTGTTAERMRIDSSGNVGIGTSSPTQKLTVFGNGLFSGGYVYAAGGGQGFRVDGVIIADRDQDFGITLIGGVDNTLRLRTGNTTRATIDSSGNVGIGTTSPASKLNVVGGNVYIQSSGTYSEPAAIAGILAFDTINGDLTISSRSNGGNTIVRFFTSNAGTGAERMRIDSSGNVGIGTTSPLYTAANRVGLTINGTTTSILTLSIGSSTSTSSYIYYDGTTLNLLNNTAAGAMTFATVGAERMRINSSGNVGIGTTSPTQKLTLENAAASVYLNTTDNTVNTLFGTNTGLTAGYAGTLTNHPFVFATNNTERMRITNAGNLGIGTASPAARLDLGTSIPGVDTPVNHIRTTTFTSSWPFDFSSMYDANDIQHFISFNTRLSGGTKTSPVFTGTYPGFVIRGTSLTQGLTFNTTAAGTGGLTERMRIDSSGNVGIGTTSIGARLDITSSAAFSMRITGPANVYQDITDGTGTLRLQLLSNTPYITSIGAYGFSFGTNNTERMRIDSAGNVGVGTASPTSLLTVAGPAAFQAPSTKTGNYSMVATDSALIFNGTGSITLTLQAASSYTGRMLYVKTIAAQTVVSASSNVVPIDSSTAGTAILAATAGKWAILQSDGTNWVVIASN